MAFSTKTITSYGLIDIPWTFPATETNVNNAGVELQEFQQQHSDFLEDRASPLFCIYSPYWEHSA